MKLTIYITFIILWALDTVFTIMFTGQYGVEAEANPLMRYVIENWGNGGFIAVKILAATPVTALYKHMHWVLYAALAVIMVPVVIIGGIMALT